LFDELREINKRPEPFQYYTAEDLWTDEHTSKKMLEYHLNESIDVSSRNVRFIDRSVAWIVDHFKLNSGSGVLDFGCGPGLYTNRLAAKKIKVTGIDFSGRSVDYARQQASWELP
jgi:2-polyprenyl-3-methyl-5-hydroxy-6-metoxy-1,4-benzoquinol methylase